jgi:hypothetical protein
LNARRQADRVSRAQNRASSSCTAARRPSPRWRRCSAGVQASGSRRRARRQPQPRAALEEAALLHVRIVEVAEHTLQTLERAENPLEILA